MEAKKPGPGKTIVSHSAALTMSRNPQRFEQPSQGRSRDLSKLRTLFASTLNIREGTFYMTPMNASQSLVFNSSGYIVAAYSTENGNALDAANDIDYPRISVVFVGFNPGDSPNHLRAERGTPNST